MAGGLVRSFQHALLRMSQGADYGALGVHSYVFLADDLIVHVVLCTDSHVILGQCPSVGGGLFGVEAGPTNQSRSWGVMQTQ